MSKIALFLQERLPGVEEVFDAPLPGCAPPYTRVEVLAALIGINGGSPIVRGWGVHSGGGPYGREGLTQDQALALLSLWAYVEGYAAGVGEHTDSVKEFVEAEWHRVAALGELPPPKEEP